MKSKIIITFLISIIISCNIEHKKNKVEKLNPEQIVVISKNAPDNYTHYIDQDSLGKITKDTLGPRMNFSKNGFTYFDAQKNVKTWKPKSKINDTLIIPCFVDYLELSTNNPFTAIKESFLIKNGDTVVFTYSNNIPKAEVKNRKVNEIELNYNKYRLKKLFNNKYTNHQLIFYNIFLNDSPTEFEKNSIEYYQKALKDFNVEMELLDSLKNSKVISKVNYEYRVSALNGLMENHKNNKIIKTWLENSSARNNKEILQTQIGFDLSKTDSLMSFSFFRDYLDNLTKYNLYFITENNGGSGGKYIDSRIRFDSIVQDKRLNQTAKNYLLLKTYRNIEQNFRVKDKEKYFKKLQKETTNREQVAHLAKEFKLDFDLTENLMLTSLKNESLTFDKLIEMNKGKWLYIDFWASSCVPCRKTMPASRKLKNEFKTENIEFIYLSLNDIKENWKKAIIKDSIQSGQHYFIENGNTSKVIEELNIRTIPHYLIYNPKGELINGYADRPGKGANVQLKKLMNIK
ncbi:MAG: hypothetical protein APF83_12325 [Lutibacter sp. BRH_c52]|nr:MAG: hypothetical protein APF83_12325 [Lutibacter sp. BRH_c52]